MSSLLSGIRFVSKEESSSDSDNSYKKDKKSKKSKSKSKSKSKKSKSKSKSKRYDSEKSHGKEDNDSKMNQEMNPSAKFENKHENDNENKSKTPLKREAWMTTPMQSAALERRHKEQKVENDRKKEIEDRHQLEIEAGIREPVTGLRYGISRPQEESKQAENFVKHGTRLKISDHSDSSTNKSRPFPRIGDGGDSWRAKMLQRAKDTAASTGESIENVVGKRYGHVDELKDRSRYRADTFAHKRSVYKRSDIKNDEKIIEQIPRKESLKLGLDGPDSSIVSKFATRLSETLGKLGDIHKSGTDGSSLGGLDFDKILGSESEEDKLKGSKTNRGKGISNRTKDQDRWGRNRRSRSRSNERRRNYRNRSRSRSYDRKRMRIPSNNNIESQSKSLKKIREEKQRTEEEKKESAARTDFLYGRRESKSKQKEDDETIDDNQTVDLNRLAANIMRAKLQGNHELVSKLSKQFTKIEEKVCKTEEQEDNVVVLHSSKIKPTSLQNLPKRKFQTTSSDGLSIEEMVVEERQNLTHHDKYHEKHILKTKSGYNGGKFMNTEEEFDAMPSSITLNPENSKSTLKSMKKDEQERMKIQQRATLEHNKWNQRLEKCPSCLSSKIFPNQNLIATGKYVYLTLLSSSTPYKGRRALIEYHCRLASIAHLPASTHFEEEVIEEMEQFKYAIRQMFNHLNQSVVFLEYTFPEKRQRHTFIDCVPIPIEQEQDVQIYFKQALNQVDEEWSTHKKVIMTNPKKKPIYQAIPKQFPYFHVEWTTGGYAHVIEDENQFPSTFGLEVLSGMLEIDPFNSAFLFSSSKTNATENIKLHNQHLEKFHQMWQNVNFISSN